MPGNYPVTTLNGTPSSVFLTNATNAFVQVNRSSDIEMTITLPDLSTLTLGDFFVIYLTDTFNSSATLLTANGSQFIAGTDLSYGLQSLCMITLVKLSNTFWALGAWS
jgi:hypothetical protein